MDRIIATARLLNIINFLYDIEGRHVSRVRSVHREQPMRRDAHANQKNVHTYNCLFIRCGRETETERERREQKLVCSPRVAELVRFESINTRQTSREGCEFIHACIYN